MCRITSVYVKSYLINQTRFLFYLPYNYFETKQYAMFDQYINSNRAEYTRYVYGTTALRHKRVYV